MFNLITSFFIFAQVQEAWIARYNGFLNSGDIAHAPALDNEGNVYVTGWSGPFDNFDYATFKYNLEGNELWIVRYNGPGNSLQISWDIAVDNSGSVIVTGYLRGRKRVQLHSRINFWSLHSTIRKSENEGFEVKRINKGGFFMKFHIVPLEKPKDVNVIMGQSHFIKTVEDLHEALVNTVPGIKFGLAFTESSGPRLIRYSGTDEELIEYAKKNVLSIGAGHVFIILLRNAFPINVLNSIKRVPEVVRIFAASSNPIEVLVAETDQGRGVIGVVDGFTPLAIETEKDIKERKEFLRKIGYKF